VGILGNETADNVAKEALKFNRMDKKIRARTTIKMGKLNCNIERAQTTSKN
jgi:hypothetical protein